MLPRRPKAGRPKAESTTNHVTSNLAARILCRQGSRVARSCGLTRTSVRRVFVGAQCPYSARHLVGKVECESNATVRFWARRRWFAKLGPQNFWRRRTFSSASSEVSQEGPRTFACIVAIAPRLRGRPPSSRGAAGGWGRGRRRVPRPRSTTSTVFFWPSRRWLCAPRRCGCRRSQERIRLRQTYTSRAPRFSRAVSTEPETQPH